MDSKALYTPIEKDSKNKFSLFKFVSLRSPNLISEEDADKSFVYHPDLTKSFFIKNIKSSLSKEKLIEISNDFTNFASIDELKKLNEPLFAFSDWLIRNRNLPSVDDLKMNLNGVTKFKDEQEILVWDNLFYQIITNSSLRFKEILITIIVANYFIKKHGKYLDNVKDINSESIIGKDLIRLASAKTIIPKEILAKKVVAKSNQKNTAFFQEKAVNTEEVFNKITIYQKAIEELKYLNELYTKELDVAFSKVESKAIALEKQNLKNIQEFKPLLNKIDEDSVIINSVDTDEIINSIGNPLDLKKLKGKVSEETFEVVKLFDLNSKYNEPISAINALESEVSKINSDAFGNINISKKVVSSGGSLIKLDTTLNDTSDIKNCSTPTISGNFISQDIISNTVTSANPNNLWGSAGGSSQEKIAGDGFLQWEIASPTRLNGNIAVGLSFLKTNNNFETIDYGFKTSFKRIGMAITSAYSGIIEKGRFIDLSQIINVGDVFKIERVSNNIIELYI